MVSIMIDHDTIMSVLETIPDPEMPISIVDLGLVQDVRIDQREGGDACVRITILPTFIGCPALPMIESEIRQKVSDVEGVSEVEVEFVNDPPWSVDRISEAGRESLREFGVTVPEAGSGGACGSGASGVSGVSGGVATVEFRTSAIACPFCESNSTRLESPFGPTRCRMIYYCDACKNVFEHMKRV